MVMVSVMATVMETVMVILTARVVAVAAALEDFASACLLFPLFADLR